MQGMQTSRGVLRFKQKIVTEQEKGCILQIIDNNIIQISVLDFGIPPDKVDPRLVINVPIKMATENEDTSTYQILNT